MSSNFWIKFTLLALSNSFILLLFIYFFAPRIPCLCGLLCGLCQTRFAPCRCKHCQSWSWSLIVKCEVSATCPLFPGKAASRKMGLGWVRRRRRSTRRWRWRRCRRSSSPSTSGRIRTIWNWALLLGGYAMKILRMIYMEAPSGCSSLHRWTEWSP